MRNEFAKTKGYDTYFDYMVDEIYDIKPQKLDELLNGVYSKVGKECGKYYQKRKNELIKAFGISQGELKDWHYGLLTSDSPDKAINDYIKSKEQVVDIAKKVYSQMGYDVENMGITLDLFPRENKNTHGFAFCIKPGKDARILANLTNNATSLDTILHELGHCVYDIGIDTNLPFIEQDCSSSVMTEAIAMMMGDLPKAEGILSEIVPAEKAKQRAVIDADAEKIKIIIAAEAQAESIRKQAEAEADQIRMTKTAEAEGVKAVKLAEAEGLRASLMADADAKTKVGMIPAEVIKAMIAAGMTPEGIVQYMTVDHIEGIAAAQAQAFEHIHLGQVNVYGSENTAANFMTSVAEAAMPLIKTAEPVKNAIAGLFGGSDKKITDGKDHK
jgi:hypothetical protein